MITELRNTGIEPSLAFHVSQSKINVIIDEKDRKGEWFYAEAIVSHSGFYRI